MNDAARSVKQNIQEGYRQGHIGKYNQYLADNARPSLSELEGDIEDSHDDGLISKEIFERLNKYCKKLDYLLMRTIQGLEAKRNREKDNK